MRRALHNELRIEWTALPVSPLLISAGEGRFVRIAHPETGTPTAYIPGSAFKGALRAATQGMMESVGLICCSLEASCHEKPAVRLAKTSSARYVAHCPACQYFGSRALQSRITLTDAYPTRALNELDMHDLTDGEVCESINGEPFEGSLIIQNFERWQIGLLGAVFAQINAGNITIGANRSAGMGRLSVRFNAAAVTYFGFYPDDTWQALGERVHGIGSLMKNAQEYGFVVPDIATETDLPAGSQFDSGFGFARVLFQDDVPRLIHPIIEQFLFRQLPAWEQYILVHTRQS